MEQPIVRKMPWLNTRPLEMFWSKHQKAVAWATSTQWFQGQANAPPVNVNQVRAEVQNNPGWKWKQASNYAALLMRIVVTIWLATSAVPIIIWMAFFHVFLVLTSFFISCSCVCADR